MNSIDCLVVGAGFSGAVIAERLARGLDRQVLLIDKRDHLGGNAYDYQDALGVRVHRYGPHIFHTNSQRVWAYLSQFSNWHPYEHEVLAAIDGKLVPIPFNLNTLHQLFTTDAAARLEHLLIDTYGYSSQVPILKLRQQDDPNLCELAEFVYEKVFLGYTTKMWGLTPEQLSPGVTARVPVSIGHDNRYFQDRFQAMPKDGYANLFQALIDHPRIQVKLGVDYFAVRDQWRAKQVFFTGPIDAYFNCCYGPLPYRSLRFVHAQLPGQHQYQPTGTVNYPNEHAYTRITEFSHFAASSALGTSIVTEYPSADGDPYYPIPNEHNEALYKRYQALAAAEPRVHFVGRLARYRYYNMDQCVAAALHTVEAGESH